MRDLAVVMPVYNEEECIAQVLGSWKSALDGLGMDYRILVLDDGSRDETPRALEAFEADPRFEIERKENSGHGPTILEGYRRGVAQAEWVFQCDSDGEMGPEHFAALWERRAEFDALFGVRTGREQSLGRRLISAVSRLTVRLAFGPGVRDVNTPYRLMRADVLGRIVEQIPPSTFAPNIVISGALGKAGLRILNHPVPHQPRATGRPSLVRWNLWKSAARAFLETLRCRPKP